VDSEDSRKIIKREFISYNSLSWEDRLIFSHSGLDRFIKIAGNLLSKRIGSVEADRHNKPYFSDKDLGAINYLIRDLLIMILKNGHARSRHIRSQDLSFQFEKPGNRLDFPAALYVARFSHAKGKLMKNKSSKEKIEENSSLPGSAFSKKLFAGIPSHQKIRYGLTKMTETETRAVGVLYMVNLAWMTFKDYPNVLNERASDKSQAAYIFQFGVRLFSLLDTTDQLAGYAAAGSKPKPPKPQFKEVAQFIDKLIKSEPEIERLHLLERIKQKIDSLYLSEDDLPSTRWVEDKIREIKRKLRRK
jgi:hypothetical protein